MQLQISTSVIAELANLKKLVADRIRAERETQGKSFKQLERGLEDKNIFGYSENYIRKAVGANNVNEELKKELYELLKIEEDDDEYTQTIAAYRYNKLRKSVPGAVSKKRIAERKELYNQIYKELCKELEKSKGCSVERVIIERSQKVLYNYKGIECDWETYYEFVEEDIKIEKLKKLYLINGYYPELVDNFIDEFEFNDEDKEELEKLDIDIQYNR